MDIFLSSLPDEETLLNLEPQEFAKLLLGILQEDNAQMFGKNNLCRAILDEMNRRRSGSRGDPAKRRQLSVQVFEAIAWLENHLLVVREPTQNNSSWICLSRRGRELVVESDFTNFQLASRLSPECLHPKLADKVWRMLLRGELAEAVFSSMQSVEVAVRKAAGLPASDIGVKLMRLAFGPNGPLRDRSANEAEEDALAHLFAGAIGSYKNRHSHRDVPLDGAGEAIELVMLASHLLRIVDSRSSSAIQEITDA